MLLERWGKLLWKSIITSSSGSGLLEWDSVPKHCISVSPKTPWGTRGTYSMLKMTLDTCFWGMPSHLKFKCSQRTQWAAVSSSNTDIVSNFSHCGLSCKWRRVQHFCKFFNTQKHLQGYQLVKFSKLNYFYRMDTLQPGTFLRIPDRALNEPLPM